MDPPRLYPRDTPHGPDESGRPAFESLLARAHADASSAFPDVAVPLGELAAYIEARVPDGEDAATAASRMHLVDLYLACACARGDARALRRFEEAYSGEVDRAYRRITAKSAQQADVA